MVSLRKENFFIMVIMFLVKILSIESRNTVLHNVGGGKNDWAPGINFSEWAMHEHFYVGDWLYFGFDKYKYNVLEVNITSYRKCDNTSFITNVTRGGRDVFNLTQLKPYYFIDGIGDFCYKGMKVAINVEEAPANPPSYSSSKMVSPSIQLIISMCFWILLLQNI